MSKENYPSAILIAYRLYYKYIGHIAFNDFEILITDNYNDLVNRIGVKLNDYKVKYLVLLQYNDIINNKLMEGF